MIQFVVMMYDVISCAQASDATLSYDAGVKAECEDYTCLIL